MVRVFLPSGLRRIAGGKGELSASGDTVREIIDDLDQQFPGLRDRLCDGDRLKPGLSVVVGSTFAAEGLLQPVPDDGEVHFLPSVGGG
jgi:molybdopterin synthase sulfur carrier subunit